MGFTVPASTTVDITSQFSMETLRGSDDLRTQIASSNLDIFGVSGIPLPLANFDFFQAGAQVGFGGHWVTPTEIIDLNDNVKSITVSGVTLSGSIDLAGDFGIVASETGNTITLSTDETIATTASLVLVSGTLTEQVATLSGEVTFIVEEVVPNIESPATTVQGGFIEVDETLSTTTSTAFINKLSLTGDLSAVFSGTSSQPFRLQWYYEWGYSSASSEIETQIQVDDVDTLGTIQWSPSSTNASDFAASAGYVDMTLTSGTHFFDLDFRSTANGKTSRIQRARMALSPMTLGLGEDAPPTRGI